jgi:glutamyl-tRNA(Gln) amidotransferase subunit E
VLASIQFARHDRESILALVPLLREKFAQINTSRDPEAGRRWMMKKLRKMAIGNVPLAELAAGLAAGGAR